MRFPREYQAHLQGISDFLLCGEGVWWKHVVSGVEFLDGVDQLSSRPQGPSLHHFRSSSLKVEEQHLKQCWDACLADEAITIPPRVIRLYSDNGDCIQVIHTNFLDHDEDDDDDDDDGDDNNDNDEAEDYVEADVLTNPDQQHEPDYCDDDDAEKQIESLEVSLACSVANKELGAFDDQDGGDDDEDESTEGLQIPNSPSVPSFI